MHRNQVLDALANLSRGQFRKVVFRLGISESFLSGGAQVEQAIDVIRQVEQQDPSLGSLEAAIAAVQLRYPWRPWPGGRVAILVGAVGALLVAAFAAFKFVSQRLSPRGAIAGYICSSLDGRPVNTGTVEVLDFEGRVLSARPELLDDQGFFVADLSSTAGAPATVRISGGSCDGALIRIADGMQTRTTCTGEAAADAGPLSPHRFRASCSSSSLTTPH